jgi:hypothetical protein
MYEYGSRDGPDPDDSRTKKTILQVKKFLWETEKTILSALLESVQSLKSRFIKCVSIYSSHG